MKKTICAALAVIFGVNISYAGGTALESLKASVPPAVLSGLVVAEASKGYVEPVEPAAEIEWVSIGGGRFTMGTTGTGQGFEDARPLREVAVKTFQMSRTAVTVAQYAACVAKGNCTAPGTGDSCNWGKPGRQLHPVNCVDWGQAVQYARFAGARLPSESEWEYAATSGGRNQKYPWGNEEPACDKAVMYGNRGYGCGATGTMPVCSKPAGNTAQGLCDMAGNVQQWVQDKYRSSYKGAPADGGAVEAAGLNRVIRGGSFYYGDAGYLRADFRGNYMPGSRSAYIGIRLVRSGL